MAAVLTGIRLMRRSDVPAVAAIEAELFPNPYTPQMLLTDLEKEDSHYLVIEDSSSRIVAYGGIVLNDDVGHVVTLATLEEERRRGFGTLLLVDLLEWAIGNGAARLTLEVHSGNESAIRLYERCGFVPAGIRRNYYRDGDALIMWAHDADSPMYRLRLMMIKVVFDE